MSLTCSETSVTSLSCSGQKSQSEPRGLDVSGQAIETEGPPVSCSPTAVPQGPQSLQRAQDMPSVMPSHWATVHTEHTQD